MMPTTNEDTWTLAVIDGTTLLILNNNNNGKNEIPSINTINSSVQLQLNNSSSSGQYPQKHQPQFQLGDYCAKWSHLSQQSGSSDTSPATKTNNNNDNDNNVVVATTAAAMEGDTLSSLSLSLPLLDFTSLLATTPEKEQVEAMEQATIPTTVEEAMREAGDGGLDDDCDEEDEPMYVGDEVFHSPSSSTGFVSGVPGSSPTTFYSVSSEEASTEGFYSASPGVVQDPFWNTTAQGQASLLTPPTAATSAADLLLLPSPTTTQTLLDLLSPTPGTYTTTDTNPVPASGHITAVTSQDLHAPSVSSPADSTSVVHGPVTVTALPQPSLSPFSSSAAARTESCSLAGSRTYSSSSSCDDVFTHSISSSLSTDDVSSPPVTNFTSGCDVTFVGLPGVSAYASSSDDESVTGGAVSLSSTVSSADVSALGLTSLADYVITPLGMTSSLPSDDLLASISQAQLLPTTTSSSDVINRAAHCRGHVVVTSTTTTTNSIADVELEASAFASASGPIAATAAATTTSSKRRTNYKNVTSSNRTNSTSSVPEMSTSMAAATLKALETCSLTPLIKEELKYTIQSRRLAAGKPEMPEEEYNDLLLLQAGDPESMSRRGRGRRDDENKKMTAEEREKYIKRREQNRKAAERFRQKQKDTETVLSKKCRKLEGSNGSLRAEIKRLARETRQLQEMLDSHLCHRVTPKVKVTQ